MKKIIIPALLLAFSLHAKSQKNDPSEKESLLRFGVKGGLNINKIEGRSFKDEFSYNFQLGAFMQINFSRKLGVQPELNFAQATAEQSDDITVIYDDIFLGGDQVKAKLNYLKLAGLLNLNVGPTQRVKLQFGPQFGILLNEKVDSVKISRDVFKNGEFSVLGGIMFQLPAVHVGARYEVGLTDINGIDNQDAWKRQALQLFIGITL